MAIPSLLLVLHSGMIPVGPWVTLWYGGNKQGWFHASQCQTAIQSLLHKSFSFAEISTHLLWWGLSFHICAVPHFLHLQNAHYLNLKGDRHFFCFWEASGPMPYFYLFQKTNHNQPPPPFSFCPLPLSMTTPLPPNLSASKSSSLPMMLPSLPRLDSLSFRVLPAAQPP